MRRERRKKEAELSTFERRIMLAMGLKDVRELEELLATPINPEAARTNEPPDDQYELLEKLEEVQELQQQAQQALAESEYVN
jgi:hypothetical protein